MTSLIMSLNEIKEREELLEKIKRYSMWNPMFYRTDVSFHTKRMEWIADVLLNHLKHPNIDATKLKLLCRIHDDVEIITGDHQLGRKLYTMKKDELESLQKQEEQAIDRLSSRWPVKIERYDYKELLKEANEKKTVEAQLMKLIDRLDGLGESLHEIYSGNSGFLRSPELEEGINPVQTYTKILSETPQKYPLLVTIFDGSHPFLSPPKHINQQEIIKNSKLPDKDSIKTKTNHPHYDLWKELTIEYGGELGLKQLTTKLE